MMPDNDEKPLGDEAQPEKPPPRKMPIIPDFPGYEPKVLRWRDYPTIMEYLETLNRPRESDDEP